MRDLAGRFDWDGVNLAELYFESLEGHDNPARLTPMNADVRAEFQQTAGFDPLELFDPKSPRYYPKTAPELAKFLDFRAGLARRQQAEWIEQIEAIRRTRPHLDLVVTHVDDRFDTSMREKIGADAARLLPLLGQHDFTFLIEDPATIWNLGPQRYPQIAARYAPLTPSQDKLAIDINIVERYQDVYPTKQQTGTELFELVQAEIKRSGYDGLLRAGVVLTGMHVLLTGTRLGLNIYGVGGNAEAARLAGVDVRHTKVIVLVLSAVMASLAGLIVAARLDAGSGTVGEDLLLDSIAAVVIGGTSLLGGVGRISGTVLGVVLIASIRNGLVLLNVSAFWQQVAIGSIILLAVSLDHLAKERS